MITDYQRYCGSALAQIVDCTSQPVQIRRAFSDRNGYYILNEQVPLLLKFSTSRRGPWNFNYKREHQLFYRELVRAFGDCITAFVCGSDGIPAVTNEQRHQFLDDNFEEQETVTIRRKHNEMYSIKGKDGELSSKVARDSLSNLIGELLER